MKKIKVKTVVGISWFSKFSKRRTRKKDYNYSFQSHGDLGFRLQLKNK